MLRQSIIVKLDIIGEVFVLFLIKQVLLSSFWNLIRIHRAARMELSLVLRNPSVSGSLNIRYNLVQEVIVDSELVKSIDEPNEKNTYITSRDFSTELILYIVTNEDSGGVRVLA